MPYGRTLSEFDPQIFPICIIPTIRLALLLRRMYSCSNSSRTTEGSGPMTSWQPARQNTGGRPGAKSCPERDTGEDEGNAVRTCALCTHVHRRLPSRKAFLFPGKMGLIRLEREPAVPTSLFLSGLPHTTDRTAYRFDPVPDEFSVTFTEFIIHQRTGETRDVRKENLNYR